MYSETKLFTDVSCPQCEQAYVRALSNESTVHLLGGTDTLEAGNDVSGKKINASKNYSLTKNLRYDISTVHKFVFLLCWADHILETWILLQPPRVIGGDWQPCYKPASSAAPILAQRRWYSHTGCVALLLLGGTFIRGK